MSTKKAAASKLLNEVCAIRRCDEAARYNFVAVQHHRNQGDEVTKQEPDWRMSERDELVEVIDGSAIRLITGLDELDAHHAADAILAAGYSKHGEELAKYKRGAKTLGEIIEKQCRDVLDVTGLHHLINEDGDGAWDVVWMRLFEMRDDLASLKESTIWRERKRGDAWRDRAQEMTLRAEAAEAALAASKRAAFPPRVEGVKPHCPDCSGIVGETGIVW